MFYPNVSLARLGLYVVILLAVLDVSQCLTKQRSAYLNGQIILGALFPVHHKPPSATAYSRTCGAIREYYGIQRVETFLLTLDKINADPNILPGVRLGCDIRDSCWYSAIALEQSINFIKDAIASKTQQQMKNPKGNETNSCETDHRQPIAGLIGPGSSEATIQVQNLLQIFNIPQIGYSATSMDLSKKTHFKYFLRVVPPDNYQAKALVDVVKHFNWTYISIVATEGNYGMKGKQKFKDLADANGICIATSDTVASSASPEDVEEVITNLKKTKNATVVVCFCEGLTVKALLEAAERMDAKGKFLIIGSDGWGNRRDVVENIEHLAAGGISIKLYSPPIPDFDLHYGTLRHNNNSRNPWFQEFWQERFKCYLAGEERDTRYNTSCTGNETLAGAEQDSKLGFVVNAVYTLANALDRMLRAVCGEDAKGLCPQMTPINGSELLQHIYNVTFNSYSNDTVYFDENGNPPGRYDILNFQPKVDKYGNTTYVYETIGSWSSGVLDMNDDRMYWPGNTPKSSVCSLPCSKGHFQQVKDVQCCWVCTKCQDNEIVVNNTCKPCPQGQRSDFNLTDCEMIPEEFISWSATEAIVSMALACCGMVATIWVFYVFIRHNNTPVVKASTRELSYIILIGTMLAYCCNFVMVAKPTITSCYLSRILPGLAFSLIYGALVTKTNRIARILEGSKRILTKKPRFMSASAQVVITGIVIGVECAVITGMLIIEPADSEQDYPTTKRVRLVCNTSTLGVIVPLGFDVFLIFMCTLYAIKTRNLPENFNEAKFIGFTMYTTCVIWLGFFPIYFGGESKEVTMCISITLSASVSLVLLFFPKVYVIVWSPERNTRGAFTTSRDVRCHIGSKSLPSCDSVDQKEKKYEGFFKSDIGRPPGPRDGWSKNGDRGGTTKRSSFPHTQASPQHTWFCNQRPSHIAEMQQSRRRCSPGPSSFRKQVSEDMDMLHLPPLDSFQEEPSTPPPDIVLRKDAECQTEPNGGSNLRHRFVSDNHNGPSKTILVPSPRSYSPEVHHFCPNQNAHESLPLLGIGSVDQQRTMEDEDLANSSDSDMSFLEDMQALEAAVHSSSHQGRMNSLTPNNFKFTKSQHDQRSLSPSTSFRVQAHSPSSLPESPVPGPSSTNQTTPRASGFVPNTLSGFSSQDSVLDEGTFQSLLSLTGSVNSARTPEELSVFSLSPLDSEEKRMLDFQKYLQNHGVKLDMSSVQSSDL